MPADLNQQWLIAEMAFRILNFYETRELQCRFSPAVMVVPHASVSVLGLSSVLNKCGSDGVTIVHRALQALKIAYVDVTVQLDFRSVC